MRAITLLAVFLTGALLIGCGSTQVVRTPTPLQAGVPSQGFELLWQLNIGKMDEADGRGLNLASDSQRLFVAGTSGRLTALWKQPKSRYQDQVIWQIQFEPRIISGPVLSGNRLIVGTSKGDVLMLSAENGELLWQTRLNSEVVSQPVLTDDRVFVRTNDGRVVALNLQTGETIWAADHQMPNLFLRGAAPVLLDGDSLFVGRESGVLEALSVQNGSKQWDVRIAAPKGRTDLERMVDLQSKLILDSGRLLVLGFNGQLASINPKTGNFQWTKELTGYRDMLLHDRVLYVIDENDILRALDPASGTEYWVQNGFKFRQTAQVEADQLNPTQIRVTDGLGFVHWLNAKDGGFIARFKHADHLNDGEKVMHWLQEQDKHYVLDSDGNITAYQQTTRPGGSAAGQNQ